jgi:hypothetical protein
MMEQRSHQAITDYLLCREFGWTPHELRKQNAKDIEQFIFILNEAANLRKLIPQQDKDATTILVTED